MVVFVKFVPLFLPLLVVGLKEEEGGLVVAGGGLVRLGRVGRSGAGSRRGGRVKEEVGQGHGVEEGGRGKASSGERRPVRLGEGEG